MLLLLEQRSLGSGLVPFLQIFRNHLEEALGGRLVSVGLGVFPDGRD